MVKFIRDCISTDCATAKENIHSKTTAGTKASGKMACSQVKANIVKDMIQLKEYGDKVTSSVDQSIVIFANLSKTNYMYAFCTNQKRTNRKYLIIGIL